MATVIVSTQNPTGGTKSKYYELLAQVPHRLGVAVGDGDIRVIATTTDNAAGTVADLTALGFTFPNQQLRVVRMRGWGRGADATEAQYIERVGLVIGQPTTPVIGNATAISADIGTVAGVLAVALSTNNVIVTLLGQTAQAMNWIVEISVDDPVGMAAGS